jgi:hypothetical protein
MILHCEKRPQNSQKDDIRCLRRKSVIGQVHDDIAKAERCRQAKRNYDIDGRTFDERQLQLFPDQCQQHVCVHT